MYKRVMQFLKEHNILCQKLCGIQKKISTAHAIIKLIEDIEESLANKQSVLYLLTCKKPLIQSITTYC